MEEDAEVEAQGGDVATELPATAFGQAFGRFQLQYDAPFDQHVDAMEADLLAPEGYAHWVLSIDAEPSVSHRDLEGPRIEGLDEPVSELVIHIEEAADNGMAELLFYDDRLRGA